MFVRIQTTASVALSSHKPNYSEVKGKRPLLITYYHSSTYISLKNKHNMEPEYSTEVKAFS